MLNPAGDVARQQRDIIYVSTGLMLLIIVPVMVLIVLFAWRYRKGGRGTYDPDFDHSTALELVDLVGAAADHHRARRADLVEHASARSVPADRGRRPAKAAPAQAAGGAGGLAGLEVAVHLSGTGHRHGQRTGAAGGPAGPVRHHVVQHDEHLLRADAGRHDLRHAGHAEPAARGARRPGDYEGFSANYSGAGFSDMRFR